jgi:hypothetical protein
MTNAMPILIILWAVVTGLFLAVLAYNATITRYEEDQLFLSDINKIEQEQQKAILDKVHSIQPALRTLGSLSGLFALVIILFYTWDCWQRLRAL